jgi:adenylate cyclase
MLGQTGVRQPPPEAIRAGLARISASSGFANSERMRQFIGFVVNQTLAGEAETLKEYLVGVEVFGRADFDPRTDTIVRVEARRLRKKLEEYYAAEGRLDAVLITLPLGSYVPVFETRAVPIVSASPKVPRGRLTVLLAVGAVAVLALALGALSLYRHRNGPTAPIASVAVLPFLDMSQAKDQESLCDGLGEELINALSAVPALKVAARTSTFRYKGKADDIRRIGADLGVEYIVEGSVRTSGKRLRVTAQLVRVRDGYHVWSREFDREFTEIFAVQEELARAVASSVGAELGAGITVIRSSNIDAYRLYLEGRHYWRQFLPRSTAQAVAYFQQAIDLDPSFAPAYAGLGDSYMQMGVYHMGPAPQLMEKARQAATRALFLESNSAEAETTLGAVSAFYDWDWNACERHFRRAVDAQPNDVNAHWLFATTCLAPQGHLEEALAEARRAVLLDPLSPLTHSMAGAVLWYRREFDPALAELDEALRLDSSYIQASLFKTFVHLSRSHFDLAAAIGVPSEWRIFTQAKRGDTAGAQAELARLTAASGNPLAIAGGYAGLGQADDALSWLEKAAEVKSPQLIWINFQAPFDALHSTARYRAIRTRMHLP